MLIHPWLVLAALSLEAAIGYPRWLYRFIRHPVVWIGALIGFLERRLNRPHVGPESASLPPVDGGRVGDGGAALDIGPLSAANPAQPNGGNASSPPIPAFPPSRGKGDHPGPTVLRFATRRLSGVGLLAVICVLAGAAGWAVQSAPLPAPAVSLIVVLAATTGLAQRSLYDHVAAVATALRAGDLTAARLKVGRIVGRDTAGLDADGVAKAAIESLAESFSDGVVAPAFWLLMGGLPGLLIYKAVNTADSMIGHREERWRAFGWASARFDDLLNLVPARLSGVLIAAAGRGGWRTLLRDAHRHASPNAGWPEAAMAGALGRTLGGPAAYGGEVLQRPILGDGPAPTAADLDRALRLYLVACGLLWALLILGGLAWRR